MSQPTPKLPGLGLPDDRRETPQVDLQGLRTKSHLMAHHAMVQQGPVGYSPEARRAGVAELAEELVRKPGHGMTVLTHQGSPMASSGVHPGYAVNSELRVASYANPKEIATDPQGPQGTQLHEDLHQMLNRVEAQHGYGARRTLARNLYHAIPTQYRTALREFTDVRNPGATATDRRDFEALEDKSRAPVPHEERLALLLNYLNTPGERVEFHRFKGHTPEQAREFGTRMKRAYRALQAAAATAGPQWVKRLGQNVPVRRGKGSRTVIKAEGEPGFDDDDEESSSATEAREDMLEADPDTLADAQGRGLDADDAFAAAQFLTGKPRLPPEEVRRFVWEEDGDAVAAALRAYGMEADEEHREALQGVLRASGLRKAGPEDLGGDAEQPYLSQGRVHAPAAIVALTSSGQDLAALLTHAFSRGDVEAVALRGKHAQGMAVAHDAKTGTAWLLKPGSGPPSPCAGIAETKGSQSAREAAYYACAKHVFGLEDAIPRTELLGIDGKEVAVMAFLPPEFRSIESRAAENSMAVLQTLNTYRQLGLLHKWAVMDGVLGNVDRHSKNILASGGQPEQVFLIDHGSAFAGDSFSPGMDKSSFVPYFLRAWSPRKFNTLSAEEKLRRMPRADAHVEGLLRDWVSGLHADVLEATIARYGLDPGPALRRLAKLRAAVLGGEPVDLVVNRMWVGLESWETVSAVPRPAGEVSAPPETNDPLERMEKRDPVDLVRGVDTLAKTERDDLLAALQHADAGVRQAAVEHPNFPPEVLPQALQDADAGAHAADVRPVAAEGGVRTRTIRAVEDPEQ
jgi:hypothetical protein